MSPKNEPNPPARKDEDFPKVNTIPDGWAMHELMDAYNRPEGSSGNGSSEHTAEDHHIPLPTTGGHEPRSNEELFARRLDPEDDLTGAYL